MKKNLELEKLAHLFLDEQGKFVPTKAEADSLWEVFMSVRLRFRGFPEMEKTEPDHVRFAIKTIKKRFPNNAVRLQKVLVYLDRLNQISRVEDCKLR